MDHFVELVFLPVGIGFGPVAVEPETADLAVLGTQDLDTLVKILKICVKIVFKVGMMPVKGGVVEEWNDISFAAFIYKLRDQIPSDRGVGGVKIGKSPGIIKGETFVVTGPTYAWKKV